MATTAARASARACPWLQKTLDCLTPPRSRLGDGDRGEPEQRGASFERHLVALPESRDGGKAALVAPHHRGQGSKE